MFKVARVVIVVIVALIAVAYFNDPSSFKPWGDAASHVGVVVAKTVKDTGEATSKSIRDEAHKNNVIDKTKDAVDDVGNSIKQAVTGK